MEILVIRQEKRRYVIPFRPLIKWLVRLRRTPKAIAGGFALGTFVAFTPTIGVQFAIAIFLATVFNLNRPASLVTIWITNVATMAPIYTFNYWVGSLVWPGPSVAAVYQSFMELTVRLMSLDLWHILDQFMMLLGLGREIIVPLVIGSVLVGAVAAAIVYALSLGALRFIVRRRGEKRILS